MEDSWSRLTELGDNFLNRVQFMLFSAVVCEIYECGSDPFHNQYVIFMLWLKKLSSGMYNTMNYELWNKKRANVLKLAIRKKSTVFIQSSWNLVKMTSLWDTYFHQVSWGLDKNCGFFINGQFLNVSPFFVPHLRKVC